MRKNIFLKSSAILLIIISLALIYRHVVSQSVSLIILFAWFISLTLSIYLIRESIKIDPPPKQSLLVISILALLTIISLSFFALNKFHFHYDEYITAYISYFLPSLEKINWFGVVPAKGEWITQFPLLFHLLQKIFFLFGPKKILIFVSTLPYTLGTVIVVYLLTKDFLVKKLAFLTAASFIFFAPQLYLGSLGLHFHSSSFFFLFSLYTFLKLRQTHNFFYSLVLGLSMAASYLTYTASYITTPLIFLLMLFSLREKNYHLSLRLYWKSWLIFLIFIFPFLVYAIRVNPFFLQRINQINIFTGSWRSSEQVFSNLSSLLKIIVKNLSTSLKSLFTPNLSGAGEYWFGRQALFEPIGLILFLIGASFLSYKTMRKFSLPSLAILLSLITTFILAMVFTLPPAPFHRWSLAFPLLGLLIGQGLDVITLILKRIGIRNTAIISAALFTLYLISNFKHTQTMIKKDAQLNSNDIICVTNYITKNFPQRTPLFIVAFPFNAFGKELFFRLKNSYPTETNYLENLSLPKENALLIVHRPDQEIIQKIFSRFAKAAIIGDLNLRDYLLIKI